MSKYDPKFWEVSVDPAVLESVLAEPDFLQLVLSGELDESLLSVKEDHTRSMLDEIRSIIRNRLTDRQKRIVEMYFFENKSQQEIAATLGLNQQVVSKHLFGVLRNGRRIGGAIQKIRKFCRKAGIEPKKWV